MDEVEIPPSGAVFTFGRSKFADNAPSKFWIKKDLVTTLSCGDEHTAVATESGRLFSFGSNEWGQLGLGHSNNVLKPSCVKSLKPDKVDLIACGKAHTLVSMKSGKLYSFGSNADGQLGTGQSEPEMSNHPVEVSRDVLTEDVRALAAGSSHSMALGAATGTVYVWGSNTEGQLGLGGDTEETIRAPVALSLPGNARVAYIAAGYYHSALVTEEGDLYTFGDCEGGKLGHGEENDHIPCIDVPKKVDVPLEENDRVVRVACGGNHTVALTENGQAYSFGVSSNGQLGLGTNQIETKTPKRITALENHNLVHVSCGENHTLLVSGTGRLFTFGDGRHGKLCLDVETITNHFLPVYVERFRGFRVENAACGGCHTMVVAAPYQGYDAVEDSPVAKGSLTTTSRPATGKRDLTGNLISDTGPNLNQQADANPEVNVEARRRHREQVQGQKQLPPIRHHRQDRPDPDEILNIGSEIIQVNGRNADEKDSKGGDAEREDGDGEEDDIEDLEDDSLSKENGADADDEGDEAHDDVQDGSAKLDVIETIEEEGDDDESVVSAQGAADPAASAEQRGDDEKASGGGGGGEAVQSPRAPAPPKRPGTGARIAKFFGFSKDKEDDEGGRSPSPAADIAADSPLPPQQQQQQPDNGKRHVRFSSRENIQIPASSKAGSSPDDSKAADAAAPGERKKRSRTCALL